MSILHPGKEWRNDGDGHGYQWHDPKPPKPPPKQEWPQEQFPCANIAYEHADHYQNGKIVPVMWDELEIK